MMQYCGSTAGVEDWDDQTLYQEGCCGAYIHCGEGDHQHVYSTALSTEEGGCEVSDSGPSRPSSAYVFDIKDGSFERDENCLMRPKTKKNMKKKQKKHSYRPPHTTGRKWDEGTLRIPDFTTWERTYRLLFLPTLQSFKT